MQQKTKEGEEPPRSHQPLNMMKHWAVWLSQSISLLGKIKRFHDIYWIYSNTVTIKLGYLAPKQKNRKRRCIYHLCVSIQTALSCNENDGDPMDRDSQYNTSQKTKRMRTSFKHHQLRTMKSYFAINHNPDAKDLKQLAQKTGLTKRVLQVRNLLTANRVLADYKCCIKSNSVPKSATVLALQI